MHTIVTGWVSAKDTSGDVLRSSAWIASRGYPGADADFVLYNDDGTTYHYEKGQFDLTHLHWADAERKLSRSDAVLKVASDRNLIEVIGDK